MSTTKRRVLCAEPQEDICSLLRILLEQEGHEVKSVDTIHECIELADHEYFDLYMIDDGYQDGTGIELCRELRRLTPETPILFFSSAALPRDIQAGLDAGAYSYLTKPGDILEIVQTVNSILRPYRSEAGSSDFDS